MIQTLIAKALLRIKLLTETWHLHTAERYTKAEKEWRKLGECWERLGQLTDARGCYARAQMAAGRAAWSRVLADRARADIDSTTAALQSIDDVS